MNRDKYYRNYYRKGLALNKCQFFIIITYIANTLTNDFIVALKPRSFYLIFAIYGLRVL